jgi:hypothetical protein
VTCLKVILFDYDDLNLNKFVETEFKNWISQKGFQTETVCDFEDIKILKVEGPHKSDIEEIIKHPAVKELSFFPIYQVVEPNALNTNFITSQSLPVFNPQQEYPKIGIIDSGIPENHSVLKDWALGHFSYVRAQFSNNSHGTAVASLASLGHILNPGIYEEEEPIQFFDLQVLPNHNPKVGPTQGLEEDKLIARLLDSIPEISNIHGIKIWNMSLGLPFPCSYEKFSNFATVLDELQDKNNIIMVIPSGNLQNCNRRWPPSNLGESDRLQVPADSVRAISVGAIAFSRKPTSLVDIGQPTSYSCKGPGPVFLIKPELVHYSGNNSLTNSGKIDFSGQGVRVWEPDGSISEDIGTSLSAPLVSRTLSLLEYNILPRPSSNLIKALIIHNATHPNSLAQISENKKYQYAGYGKPASVKSMLKCYRSQSTLVFEGGLSERQELNYDFLWPKSLVNKLGGHRGNIKMTLASEPPLEKKYGPEYIRANVSAALQTRVTRKNKNGRTSLGWKSIIGEVFDSGDIIEDLSPASRYETELIKKNKWKPIKTYAKSFSRSKFNRLRIHVSILLRAGEKLKKPVKFALIFTLSDPTNQNDIYNETIKNLEQINIVTNEIQLREEVRQRVQVK